MINLKFLGKLNNLNYLKVFACRSCQQLLNDHDLTQKNYLFKISDYANEIIQIPNARDNAVYELRLWLKEVAHHLCPGKEINHA